MKYEQIAQMRREGLKRRILERAAKADDPRRRRAWKRLVQLHILVGSYGWTLDQVRQFEFLQWVVARQRVGGRLDGARGGRRDAR